MLKYIATYSDVEIYHYSLIWKDHDMFSEH